MEQEVMRANLTNEVNDCLLKIEKNKSIFFPEVERLLVKIELFSDEIQSKMLKSHTMLLKQRVSDFKTSSAPLNSVAVIYSELKKMKYFLENIVALPKQNTSG